MKKRIYTVEESKALVASLSKRKGKIRVKKGVMNGLEKLYSGWLEYRLLHEEIKSWKFECVRLRLAAGAHYTPDFQVINLDGSIEFHEVKGYRRTAGILRFKVAAENYPEFAFFLVERFNDRWETTAWG